MSGNKREPEGTKYLEEVVVDENDDEILGLITAE